MQNKFLTGTSIPPFFPQANDGLYGAEIVSDRFLTGAARSSPWSD